MISLKQHFVCSRGVSFLKVIKRLNDGVGGGFGGNLGWGVIWRWDARKRSIAASIVLGVIAFFIAFRIVVGIYVGNVLTVLKLAIAVGLIAAFITAIVTYPIIRRRRGVRGIALTRDGLSITDRSGNAIFIPKDRAIDCMCITMEAGYDVLHINCNGLAYKIPISWRELDKLQETLPRTWGREIRNC